MLDPPPSLAAIPGAALFLDFDGTLVELADTPGAISVSSELPPLLQSLKRRLGGRLALISGRAIEDLTNHLECSGIAVSGSHGLELRLGNGTVSQPDPPAGLALALEQASEFAMTRDLLLEEKPTGLALHYRQAPEQADAVQAFMAELAQTSGLALQQGKMVVELRPRGGGKGDALRSFMKEPEFAGARPLFVGDDLTDEDAFRAAGSLGGAGILVGPPRETAARWRLDSVSAVGQWLREAAAE